MKYPPSAAQGIRRVLGTRGIPSARFGRDGDLATDPVAGKLYLKSAGSWAFKGQGFQRLFGSVTGESFLCTTGDPLIVNLFPYVLSSSQVGSSVLLSWYLTGASSFPISGAQTAAAQVSVYLQRSPSKINNPLSPAYYSFNIGHGTLSPEAGWTTVKQWSPGDTLPGSNQDITVDGQDYSGWVGSYQDDTPFPTGEHIANYRLVYFTFNSNWIEIDWNVVTAKKPYIFTTKSQQADGLHLAWS